MKRAYKFVTRTAVLILVTFCSLTFSRAQYHEIGAKGGVTFANLAGDVSDNKLKLGPHLGGYINFRITEDLFLQPELLYTLNGATFQNDEVNLDYKDHLHYINVPVLARYFLNEDLSVHGGVYLGLFLGGKRKGSQYGFDVDEKIKNIKSLDGGFVLGLDYTLENELVIGARYNFGVLNIYKNETHTFYDEYEYEYEYSYDLTLHNRVLQVFIAFPLKKGDE